MKETIAMTIATNDIKLVMTASDMQGLEDPDLWIADTAASVHTTP